MDYDASPFRPSGVAALCGTGCALAAAALVAPCGPVTMAMVAAVSFVLGSVIQILWSAGQIIIAADEHSEQEDDEDWAPYQAA